MHPKLHIIANCTNRKSASVPENLYLRTIPSGTLEERASAWWQRLTRHQGPRIPAVDLYAGGHWAAIRNLCIVAEQVGFNQNLWAISAGYGLVLSSTCIHPYSATFSNSQPDAVTARTTDEKSRTELVQGWWNSLCSFSNPMIDGVRSFSTLVQRFSHDYFLIIASSDYILAIEQDLLNAISRLVDRRRLIIISSHAGVTGSSLNSYLIPSDARLQIHVGGALGALHARVAAMVLKNIKEWGFNAEVIRNKVEAIMSHSPPLPTYDRSPMTDCRVQNFIREALNQTPQASFTTLLRRLRDSGRACEQGRFKHLYNQVKGSGVEG
jgi:hypothetical protein